MSNEVSRDTRKIKVFYQNSSFHHTIFAGGAWAGIAPNGLVQLALFNDLRAMPEMVVHGVVDDNIGPELEKLEKQGIVREVEATILMPLNVAKALLPLIQQMIDQLEALQTAQTAQVEASASE